VAVIDWDTVISVPDSCSYRIPPLTGLSPVSIPGLIEELPVCKAGEYRTCHFVAIVEETSDDMVLKIDHLRDKGKFVFTKAGFYSKAVVVFRALIAFKFKQDRVDQKVGRWTKVDGRKVR
jgi:hypothetical protein